MKIGTIETEQIQVKTLDVDKLKLNKSLVNTDHAARFRIADRITDILFRLAKKKWFWLAFGGLMTYFLLTLHQPEPDVVLLMLGP